MFKRLSIISSIAILGCIAATTATSADKSAAETCLRTKVWDGYSEGWGLRTMATTDLKLGATKNYLVTLYKGNEYKIQSCTDPEMVNLDLYLYDMDGNVVLRDNTEDRQPLLNYTPVNTATYYIVLHARELKGPTAVSSAAMAVTYR